MTDIPFGLVMQCDEYSHESWKDLIEKYVVSDEEQESLNKITNRWNNCSIKDTNQDPYIWFNELFNLNPKFKKIRAKHERYEYELKAHILTFYLKTTST